MFNSRILLFLFPFITVSTYAQIVVQRSDMAPAGTAFINRYDSDHLLPAGFDSTGKNLTWNFKDLDNERFSIAKFHSADSTAYSASFPDAEIAIQNDTSKEDYYYAKDSAGAVHVVGLYEEASIGANPYVKFRAFIFPFQYGDKWNDSINVNEKATGTEFGYPVDSVHVIMKGNCAFEIDAEGTIQLPHGDVKVIRLKREMVVNIQAYGKIGSFPWLPVYNGQVVRYNYEFYGEKSGYYIVNAELKSGSTTNARVHYRDSLPPLQNTYTGNRLKEKVSIYPNPASNIINVDADPFTAFAIFNLQGQQLITGSAENPVDVSTLCAGHYIILLTKKDGTVLRNRFIKE